MLSDMELERLMADSESDRVERKESVSSSKLIRSNICAFANDLADNRVPGVVFIGVRDDGTCAGLAVTDQMLETLAQMRSDGNILPLPDLSVQRRRLRQCDVVVVEVQPSLAPPFGSRVGPTCG